MKLKCDGLFSNFGFKFNLRRYIMWNAKAADDADADADGEAVQVDPMKHILKPPGAKHLKLKCDTVLSTFAFKFSLRRYTTAPPAPMPRV